MTGRVVPVGVIFNNFALKGRFLRILLIPDFQSPNFSNDISLKGDVVFILRLSIRVLYYHVNGLFYVSPLQVDIPHQINIFEDLWWLEVAREDLM